MELIAHRLNTIEQLNSSPREYGAEVDIRSNGSRMIIHHDPFSEGEDFDKWVECYQHGTLILNVKEEGLEARLIGLMADHGITDYFFLDQSFPFLMKWANLGERRCAARVSEYESVETVLTLNGKIDWVWVDCFTRFPLDPDIYQRLVEAKFKLCLVSPELQGRDPESGIPALAAELASMDMTMDAVCTKRCDLWKPFC